MTMTLHPRAEKDLADAAEFYERQASAKLAGRFVAEFKRVARLLLVNPSLGTPIADGRRAFPMQVFPYSLIYRPKSGDIRVLVVRHHRKHPTYGDSRK